MAWKQCWVALMASWFLAVSGNTIVKRGEPEENDAESSSITLRMPGAVPTTDDNYLCHAFDQTSLSGTNSTLHVTAFDPVGAEASRAHHMLLYACPRPGRSGGGVFDCAHHSVCSGGGQTILFAWAKNAQPKKMPEGVSFELDPAQNKYLVLQVHYAHPLEEPDYTGLKLTYQLESTRYTASIYLMLRSYLSIPSNTEVTHGDMNCILGGDTPIHPFAFRTHAHSLGTVISGYVYDAKTQEYTEIAKGNPQWPQAFYPIEKNVTVSPEQFLAARCTYNSTGVSHPTRIGSTAGDEMCNLYLMYYTESGKAGSRVCFNEQSTKISANLPEDSDKPLPPNALLEEMAVHKMKDDKKYDQTEIFEESAGKRKKGDLESPEATPEEAKMKTAEIRMPGVLPEKDDDYFCTAFNISRITGGRKAYIAGFDARARAAKAHHIILQKCAAPLRPEGETWGCQHHAVCNGPTKIVFAWAKDAPGTELPPGVGFTMDPEKDGHLVLQVHYAHPLQEKDNSGLAITYTYEKPSYFAGIFLLFRSFLRIPPGLKAVHGDMNCKANDDLTLFAYRTHAHKLGAVITGYRVRDGGFEEIARGDPQKPQTFYPMSNFVKVKPDDYVAARCTYDTRQKSDVTMIGSTAGDEMCNLYLMYYTDKEDDDMRICGDEEVSSLSKLFPKDSDVPIDELNGDKKEDDAPSEPETPISYTNGHDDGGGDEDDFSRDKKQGSVQARQAPDYPTNNLPQVPYRPQQPSYSYGYPNLYPPVVQPAPVVIHHHHAPPPPPMNPYQQYPLSNTNQNFGAGGGGGSYPEYQEQTPEAEEEGEYDPVDGEEGEGGEVVEVGEEDLADLSELVKEALGGRSRLEWREPHDFHGAKEDVRKGKQLDDEVHLYPVPNWPPQETMDRIGQVSGVSIDAFGNPVVFHRGDRTWNGGTFKFNNEYAGDKTKPIPVDTVMTLNSTGHVVNSWGANMFFMPHMITVDRQNGVWVTDVAMHQVFKFPPYGGGSDKQSVKQPLFVLGKPFEPGSDDLHYCKPTAVAVSDDGKNFFVSDGYCNSRVIKYELEVEAGTGHHRVTKVWQVGESASGISISRSPLAFNVPHGLALAEDKNLICVADRENSRVQCFKANDGTFVKSIQRKEMGRVYSVAYSKFDGGCLYALNGPEPFGAVTGRSTQGLVIDIDTTEVKSVFNGDGDGFQNPHDVAVSSDGSVLYEVELRPFKVWKLTNAKSPSSATLSPVPAVPDLATSVATAAPSDSDALGANPAAPNPSGAPSGIKRLSGILPSSTLGVSVAFGSIMLTCCLTLCLACRRCKKRGKGTMQNGPHSKRKSRKNDSDKGKKGGSGGKNGGKLDLGDLLGRSKEGFQRVKTEEDDDDDEDGDLSSESDLEEFSVPALRA